MPRKFGSKRVVKTLDDTFDALTNIEQSVVHVRESIPKLICAIETEVRHGLDEAQRSYILDLMSFCGIGQIMARQRKIRQAFWRDTVIFALRAILVERGASPSLSFTDRAQTEIDRPFARVLRCAWLVLPTGARGRSPSALIARARTLRSHKGMPTEILNTVASSGRELILLHQTRTPLSPLDAVRYMRDGIASGEIKPSTKMA
jgi:hypothetical protein